MNTINRTVLYSALLYGALNLLPTEANAQSSVPSPTPVPSSRLELIGDVGGNLDERVFNTPLPINNNGIFVYSVTTYDSSSGYMIIDTEKKSLEVKIDVKPKTEVPVFEWFNPLWKEIFGFKKHALFYNIGDSIHVQEVDKGTDDEEIVTYALRDTSAVVINYRGDKEGLEGEVLPGESLVDLLCNIFTGQEIPYEKLKTFILGLKYEITLTDGEIYSGFEELVLDPNKSRFWEDGRWVSFADDKEIIFENLTVYFLDGVLVIAEADVNKSIFSTTLKIKLVTDQKTLSEILDNR